MKSHCMQFSTLLHGFSGSLRVFSEWKVKTASRAMCLRGVCSSFKMPMSRIDLMTCKGVNDEKGKRHPFPHQNHHHLHHYTTAAPPATAHAHISETCKCKNPSMWCAEFMASFLSVRFRFSVFLYPFWSSSVILVILFSQHSTSVVAITVKTFNNVVHIVWSKVFFWKTHLQTLCRRSPMQCECRA